jgi:hypothetical protein
VLLHGADITRVPAHRLVFEGLAFVPQTENVFANLTIAENLELAAAILKADRRERLDPVYAMFPDLQRQRTLLGRAPLGRPAPDAGGGARADREAARADARRAFGGPEPQAGGQVLEQAECACATPVSPWCWWSRTSRPRWHVADRAAVLVEGREQLVGTAPSCGPMRASPSCTSAATCRQAGGGLMLQILADGLIIGSVVSLGAIGLSLTLSILRFANFGHGELLAWGAYFALSALAVFSAGRTARTRSHRSPSAGRCWRLWRWRRGGDGAALALDNVLCSSGCANRARSRW